MLPFKKRKAPQVEQTTPNEIHVLFDQILRRIGTRIANGLSRLDRKATFAQKKIAISIFCLVGCMFWLLLFFHGLSGRPGSSGKYLSSPSITFPVSPQLPDSLQRRVKNRRSTRVGIIPDTPPDSITK